MNSVTDWTNIASVSKLLSEQEKTLDANSPVLADTCVRLGDLHFIAEDFIKAEELYWRALGIRQKALGEWHVDTAAVLQNLAELYEIQDRYAEAQRFYQWAVAAKKSSMIKKHSENMEPTQQIFRPKLPQISELQGSTCKVCGRQQLDSIVCLYCTQGGFDAMGYLQKVLAASGAPIASAEAGPVNTLRSNDGAQYALDDTTIKIGRHPSNQIALLDDKHVSRHHATISYDGGEFFIEDNKSANGTYVNSERISKRTALRRGDVVTIGETTLRAAFRDVE